MPRLKVHMQLTQIVSTVLALIYFPKSAFAVDFKGFFTSSDPLDIVIGALMIMVIIGVLAVISGGAGLLAVAAGIAVTGVVVLVRTIITGSINFSTFIPVLVILGGILGIIILLFLIGGIIEFFGGGSNFNNPGPNIPKLLHCNVPSNLKHNTSNHQKTTNSASPPSVSFSSNHSPYNQQLSPTHHFYPYNYTFFFKEVSEHQ